MSAEALDVNDFMERVQNDKELFFELLDIFISDFQQKRQLLEEATTNSDYQTIEHVAHFLKGSCGNISAESLRIIFHDLEIKGREKKVGDVASYLGDIDEKFEELVKFIGELRTKQL